MDPLTHGLSGALLARAAKKNAGANSQLQIRHWLLIVATAAMFPDIDVLFTALSNVATLTDRRGLTHSLVLLPINALILAGIFYLVFRRGFVTIAILCAAGIALHIAFDLINPFGVMLLAPFSWARFELGTTFIIDLLLTGLLVAGLIASAFWRRSRVPAIMAWSAVLIYFAVMVWSKQRAADFAARVRGTTDAVANVVPRPLSPFNWTVVLSTNSTHRYAHVNVLRDQPLQLTNDAGLIARVRAAFVPLSAAAWQTTTRFGIEPAQATRAEALWNQPDFAFFRNFAMLPALIKFESSARGDCAFFEDLRFLSPGREAHPFRYGICQTGNAATQVFEFADDGNHIAVPHPRRLLF